ncbi:RidA family protein [Acetobacterium tundrae]|uniref:RidA family protein n=1 Tax=Acetobacterium tundrae TaxID=132932 RepID=A0ABR6WH99_9FIRM|nr:RidA family protein [Acetobacterium tundrae]MBC3795643.1 RidA family protein [Acetobacterium tundrae]
MGKKIINTEKAPAAIGPYVQAIAANGTLYVSGQLGINMETGEIPVGVADQARCSLKNMSAILSEAGIDYKSVIKTTIFLTDMGDFGTVNEVYGEFFQGENPARSCVAVKALPKDGKVEIECIADLNQ